MVGHGDRKGRELCHGAVRTECILRGFRSRPRISTLPRRCPHGVHHFEITDRLTMSELCHGAVRTECIRQKLIKNSGQRALPRRCPHGVHLQKQTNFVCIMRRELVDSFSGTAKSSCADYFPILFCCQSDLYHHDRQPRTGNRPVLLCEQHSHFLCIRPSH